MGESNTRVREVADAENKRSWRLEDKCIEYLILPSGTFSKEVISGPEEFELIFVIQV